MPLWILGAGSNVVVSDDGLDGIVARVEIPGVEVVHDGSAVRLRVGAGVPWDDVVALAVSNGWSGVECLSGIPGTTGATPIQNVGAYGQDVAETIECVRILERAGGDARVLTRDECGFGYRSSAFKRGDRGLGDAVVVEVTFVLRKGAAPAVRYPELAVTLARSGIEAPSLDDVRSAVLALRRSKSMVLDSNDVNRRSVGSFFVNPVLREDAATRVTEIAVERSEAERVDRVPMFRASAGMQKLSAGWLIEHAGFVKGERRGPFAISTRHALALVHCGGGTTTQLIAFATEIRDRVQSIYGVRLEMEPVRFGAVAWES